MLFGAHISIAGGIDQSPLRAHKSGSEVFQIFTFSPRGGGYKKIPAGTIKNFLVLCQKFGFRDYYIHTPYYINLASNNNRIYHGSISAIRRDLEVGSSIKARYVMTHLGSARDLGTKQALKKVIEGIKNIFKGYNGQTQFLIELSAGAGQIIGARFEEIADIIKGVETTRGFENKIGICFDTAHAFASGYDLRREKGVKKVLKKFDKIIGLKRLKLIHANDSKSDFGSRVDRHEHIGQGKIGLDCFRVLVNHPKLKNVNMIIETPGSDEKKKNLKVLKKLRNK